MNLTFECTICRKLLKTAVLLERHKTCKSHKNREENINLCQHKCECGKSFKHRQGLYCHKNKCTNTLRGLKEVFRSEVEQLNKEKEAQIEELKHQIEELILAQTHQTINTNIGTQVNITINAFGKENLDYITEKQCLKIANQVFNSVPTAAQIVFFNPDHPENHNIKIPNKKEPYAMIMKEDSTWEMTDRKKAIEKMTQKSYSVAESSYEKVYDKVNPSKRQNFQTFMDKMNEQDPGLWRRFQQELEMKIIGATRS